MAICWTATVGQLDREFVFAPERYSARRNAHLLETEGSVPISDVAQLIKSTFNPAQTDPHGEFVVLDTTHAVEGRIQFRAGRMKGINVGSVKRPLQAGNVIVSRLRTYLRQVALVDDKFLEQFGVRLICSTEFYILKAVQEGADIAFLVPFLLSAPVQDIFKHAQEGGHHPRIHSSTLMELRLPRSLVHGRDKISNRVRQAIQTVRKAEGIFDECAEAVRTLQTPQSNSKKKAGVARERPRRNLRRSAQKRTATIPG